MKKYPKIRRPKAWLKAIDELIKKYKTKDLGIDCPLCDLNNAIRWKINKPDRACKYCLWIIFEDRNCVDYEGKENIPNNLKRLRRWKRIINKQILK